MDKIEQFIYTSSPWGKSGSGWMVFQQSSGLVEGTHKAVYPFLNYRVPRGFNSDTSDETELASFPVQFVCAKSPDVGARFILQTCYTGNRWWEGRSGDFWAQTYIVSESAWASLPLKTNPIQWLRSPSIGTRYPDEMRELAKAIINREREYEAPPDLPSLDSLDELEPNHDFDFEAILDRMPDGALSKLGGLLAAAVKRGSGAKAFVFDATRSQSLDGMAALLALMPVKSRMESQFSTYFHSDNVREIKADDTFLFYGTVREGESADPDTGIYGVVPQGGLEFRSRDDVELFKRMVDAGGAELKAEDFDSLVLCWEVASARKKDVASLREAMRFADRFPGLREEVVTGLASSTSDSLVSVVAWFEFSLSAYEDSARQVCSDCVRDGSFFAEVLRTLDGDGVRKAFADAVAKDAESSGCVSELAAMWLGCGQDVRALLARNVTGPFVSIAALADRYDTIRRDVAAKSVDPSQAAAMLAEVEKAARKLGNDFEGIEDTRNSLRYLVALAGLNDADDLASFAEAIRGLGVDEAKVRADVLARVKPGDIPVERLAKLMGAFEVVGIPKEDVLRLAIEAAEQRGRDAAKRTGHHRASEAEMRTNDVDRRSGTPIWLSSVLVAVAFVSGLAIGWTFRSLHGIGKSAVDKPDQERELPDIHIIENGEANKADAVQEIEGADILTDALQLQGDGHSFMKGTPPQDMQLQNEQRHFEAIESSRLSSPKEPFPQMESPQSQSEESALPEMPKQQQSDESASPQVQQQPEEQLQPSEASQNMHRRNLLEERREPIPVMPQKPPVEGVMIIHVEEQRVGW